VSPTVVAVYARHVLQDPTQLESKSSTQKMLTHAASMEIPSTLTPSSTLVYSPSTPTASELTGFQTHEGCVPELYNLE